MFKTYQIKWCFIVIGILISSTLLLRQRELDQVVWWEFLGYGFRLSVSLLSCWLIHGFFLTRSFPSLGNYPKYFLTNFLAMIVTFNLGFLFYYSFPKSILDGNAVGFNNLLEYIVHLTGSFFISIICFVVFYSLHTNSALQESKLENEILEQAHLRAQLISLQQQISPHFLFNSLSTLKTIASDQPTKNYVVQLASVYRYVLNFNERYLTRLKDEVNFIRSFLYIMNERFEDALNVTIEIPEEHQKLFLPSLSLQLLIENAIKHNMISPEQPLYISIRTDESPALTVENNFQPKKVAGDGTGTGLKNISERYKLLVNRSIEIKKSTEKFSVTIPLLQE